MIVVAVISIIDDDPAQCASLARLLHSLGYETCRFASAEAFLAWEGAYCCDCIITDVQMPGMSGIDLKRTLVARHCEVPVIMITGRTNSVVETEALSSGALCLLRKPFHAETLKEYVRRALAR